MFVNMPIGALVFFGVRARIPETELLQLLRGYGYEPHVVAGDDPATVHQLMAATMDECLDRIGQIQDDARSGRTTSREACPMIVLRTPKGWTSSASDSANPSWANFVEQYALRPNVAIRPPTDEIVMIRPRRAFRM